MVKMVWSRSEEDVGGCRPRAVVIYASRLRFLAGLLSEPLGLELISE